METRGKSLHQRFLRPASAVLTGGTILGDLSPGRVVVHFLALGQLVPSHLLVDLRQKVEGAGGKGGGVARACPLFPLIAPRIC